MQKPEAGAPQGVSPTWESEAGGTVGGPGVPPAAGTAPQLSTRPGPPVHGFSSSSWCPHPAHAPCRHCLSGLQTLPPHAWLKGLDTVAMPFHGKEAALSVAPYPDVIGFDLTAVIEHLLCAKSRSSGAHGKSSRGQGWGGRQLAAGAGRVRVCQGRANSAREAVRRAVTIGTQPSRQLLSGAGAGPGVKREKATLPGARGERMARMQRQPVQTTV